MRNDIEKGPLFTYVNWIVSEYSTVNFSAGDCFRVVLKFDQTFLWMALKLLFSELVHTITGITLQWMSNKHFAVAPSMTLLCLVHFKSYLYDRFQTVSVNNPVPSCQTLMWCPSRFCLMAHSLHLLCTTFACITIHPNLSHHLSADFFLLIIFL